MLNKINFEISPMKFQMIVILKFNFNNDNYFGNDEKDNFFFYF